MKIIMITLDGDIYQVNGNLFTEVNRDILFDDVIGYDHYSEQKIQELTKIRIWTNQMEYIKIIKDVTKDNLDISNYFEGPYYTLFTPDFKFYQDCSRKKEYQSCSRLLNNSTGLTLQLEYRKIEKVISEPVAYCAQQLFDSEDWLSVIIRCWLAKNSNRKLIIPLESNYQELEFLNIFEGDTVKTLGYTTLLKDCLFVPRYSLEEIPIQPLKEIISKFKLDGNSSKICFLDDLLNEQQVEEILNKYSFKRYPQTNLIETAKIIGKAEIIISRPFPGLILARPGTIIIDISDKNNQYIQMLSKLSLDVIKFVSPRYINIPQLKILLQYLKII